MLEGLKSFMVFVITFAYINCWLLFTKRFGFILGMVLYVGVAVLFILVIVIWKKIDGDADKVDDTSKED